MQSFCVDKAIQRGTDFEKPGRIDPCQRPYPVFKFWQVVGNTGCADQCADGGAAYDMRYYAQFGQRTYDADMRPAAG